MKTTIKTLLALSIFGAAALFAQAQPAPKILFIDMGKLFDNHYKTVEQRAKIVADTQKAQEELDRLNKEGNALVEHYKELLEQANSPALTTEAKAKAQADAQKQGEEIRRKQGEVQTFEQNTRNSIQQRMKTFRDLMVEEISKVAVDVAKSKGATILIDKSGPSMNGFPSVVYSDASYDISDEVMALINKDRPAASAAPAAAPAATDSTTDSPKITLPGATPKNP